MQLLNPFSLRFIKLLLQAMEDGPVYSLGLPIRLRMGHCGESSLTPQGVKVLHYFCCVELPPVVKDHCSRNAKMGDDIFPNKFSDLCRFNGGNSLSFYPLDEVIHCDKKVLVLTCGLGEGSEYVHALSSKW